MHLLLQLQYVSFTAVLVPANVALLGRFCFRAHVCERRTHAVHVVSINACSPRGGPFLHVFSFIMRVLTVSNVSGRMLYTCISILHILYTCKRLRGSELVYSLFHSSAPCSHGPIPERRVKGRERRKERKEEKKERRRERNPYPYRTPLSPCPEVRALLTCPTYRPQRVRSFGQALGTRKKTRP